MTTAIQPGGGNPARPQASGLADVLDTILDKGMVIDAYVRVSLVGIELLTIDARIVIASVDTYLRFAEAVNRLDISQEKHGLPGLVGTSELRGRTTDMSAPSATRDEARTRQTTCCYVYGLLPGDVELTSEVRGIGDPPTTVRLVSGGDLAALVSAVDLSRPLGTPGDLKAHKLVLDCVVLGAPVLPVRFGTVLTGEDAVVSELLEPHRDEFTAALDELDGTAQYVIHGRYVEQAILAEILSQNARAAKLADRVRGADADATRDLRIGLGELINNAVAAKREKDTRWLLSAIGNHCLGSLVRQPTHEMDAAYVAALAELDEADELEQAVGDLASRWRERIELRLLGPMAPYDFVGAGGGIGELR